jgi:hypothetical protein
MDAQWCFRLGPSAPNGSALVLDKLHHFVCPMSARKNTTRKRRAKKSGWGGRRRGAGRPRGTGTGPSRDARINRVVAMISNNELKILQKYAKREKLPLGTAAYQIIARTLRRLG